MRNTMKGMGGRIGHSVAVAGFALACAPLAACGSPAPAADTQATVPATTIPPIDPHSVPSRITAAYVQGVLNDLDAVDGDATRLIVANKSLVPDAVYRLEAIDANSWFTEVTSTWTDDIASGLKNYRAAPGNQRDTVEKVLSSSPNCIYTKVLSDFSAVTSAPPPPHVNYIELVRLPPGRDKGGWNPTPWMVAIEGWNSQGKAPSNPCASAT